MSEKNEKIDNSTFGVKLYVGRFICSISNFSNDMEKLSRYDTYISIEFGKSIVVFGITITLYV